MTPKLLCLSCAAALTAAAPVLAGDWDGYYIGGHIGSAQVTGDYDAYTPRNSFDGFDVRGLDGSALAGGIQGGRNWDNGTFVWGIEASLTAFGVTETSNRSNSQGSIPPFSRTVENLFILAPRIGFETGNVLLYGKAGFAASRIGAEHDQNGRLLSDDNTETGWAVGLGAEFPLAERLSGRIDATYADFGTIRNDLPGSPAIWTDQEVNVTLISLGINYRF